MTPERTTTPASWATTARDLYLVAMAVFLVTILIGILNGADAVDSSGTPSSPTSTRGRSAGCR